MHPLQLDVISTARAPVKERIALWEQRSAKTLLALRAASYAPESLVSSMLHLSLGSMSLSAIRANEHVIERSEQIVRRHPTNALMLCFLNKGRAFFYGSQGVESLERSDVIVYDADKPFMYGFKSAMAQFVIAIPRSDFYRWTGREGLREPLLFRHEDHTLLQYGRQLFTSTFGAVQRGRPKPVSEVEHGFAGLVHQLVRPTASNPYEAYFLRARAFIDDHLQLSDLTVRTVAEAVGVSERHLSRIFAYHNASVGKYVSDSRLELAREVLLSERYRTLTISEIARKVGFEHPSHFARAFKGKFGMSARDFRSALTRHSK